MFEKEKRISADNCKEWQKMIVTNSERFVELQFNESFAAFNQFVKDYAPLLDKEEGFELIPRKRF